MADIQSRAGVLASAFFAVGPLKKAAGGLTWMAQGGQRTWRMLSIMLRPSPPPLPPEELQRITDEPADRFDAIQAAVRMSDEEVDSRRRTARVSVVAHTLAAALLLAWAILAPRLGLAPGLTAVLPWAILAVVAARLLQKSHDHYHLKHRALVPFREWIRKPENILMPVFEDGIPAQAVVRGIGIVILGAAVAPVAAWAQGLATPGAVQVLASQLPASDLSLQWVQRIFPSFFSASGISTAQDATAQLLALVNTMLLTAASGFLLYEVIGGIVAAAHTGRVFSERYHGPWVPVRVALGVGAVVPISGYCVAQLLIIQITIFGYQLANTAWSAHVQLAMAISPVQGPSLPVESRWSIAPGGGTVSVPPDMVAQLPTLQALLSSELCYHAARWGSRLVGEVQNPPAEPRQQGSTALRAGQRPQYAMPPVTGTDVTGARVWDYGQVCGSISWPVRAARTVAAAPAGASQQAALRIANESRIAEREQAMRDFDIARAEAFGRFVAAVRQDQAMHWVAAVASPGFIPDGTMPDLTATAGNILTAYGSFKSEILTASTVLSATLNREARVAAMDRVTALGWAAAGAVQPALASMNRTVVERVVELPTIQGFNPGSMAASRDTQAIFALGQRHLSEAIYAALPLRSQTGAPATPQMAEVDAVRELRTNPDTAVSTMLARLSRSIFRSMEGMARLDATDPLTSIRNHGQAMEATLLGGWATWTLMNTAVGAISGGAEGVSNSILGLFGAGVPSMAIARAMGAALNAVATFVSTFFWWALALAALYSTVLPMLGFIFWMFAVAGQITYLIEAVVGAAFWAFAHVKSDNGQEFVGNAQRHGYSIAFNSAFRPTLMVIGLVLGHVVFAVTATFVNATFALAVDSAFAGEAFYGSRIISPVGLLVLMAMLFYIHYQLAVRSYALITELPDRVARWSGASGEGLGESGHFEEANRTVVAGVMTQTRAYGGAAGAARRVGTDTGKEADHRNRKAGTPGDGTSDNAVKPVSGQKDGGV